MTTSEGQIADGKAEAPSRIRAHKGGDPFTMALRSCGMGRLGTIKEAVRAKFTRDGMVSTPISGQPTS